MNDNHDVTRNNGRWVKGVSGNPNGRPKGSVNKTTLMARNLIQKEAEAITKKLIALAKEGDIQAIKICVERLVPPVKQDKSDAPIIPMNFTIDLSGQGDKQ